MTSPIDALNQATMSKRNVVEVYARPDELSPPERALFDRVREQMRGQPILDIGVGGGRTVAALREISDDYIGIDLSSEMVAACSANHPGVRVQQADARNMPFADGQFALAVFSCNGIGMVGHADRLAVLRQVHRVLRPGGLFVFSTHNRRSPDHDAGFRLPPMQWSMNPLRLGVRSLRFARATLTRALNRRRWKPLEQRQPDYSIINDVCHDYGTLLYYVDLDVARRQLVDVGFLPDALALDLAGNEATTSSSDSSLAFLATKAG